MSKQAFGALTRFGFLKIFSAALLMQSSVGAWAMDLDWSGQFRTEAHFIHGYSLDYQNETRDPVRGSAGGYYIPGGGEEAAQFQTLFLRLRPKLIVNDNIFIKSEWWLGDPIYGFFGNAVPYQADRRQWYSSQSRGSMISAQRFWGEFMSDIGTFQLGRAPLNWGLGLVWHSGDGLWDRYQSTGDMFRLVSKFGAFSFSPAFIKYSTGNNIGGTCHISGGPTVCNPGVGQGGMKDYSLSFKYDNPDEDFEGGVNFIKRIAGANPDPTSGHLGIGTGSEASQTPGGWNFNTWDIYAKKRLGRFTFAGELPVISGDLESVPYKTFALALETGWDVSDSFNVFAKAGRAPGQQSILGPNPSKFKAFYFNPNYDIALLMFNYQFANFAGPNTLNHPNMPEESLASPYDNPITNAKYLAFGGGYKTDKWSFRTNWAFASALEKALANQYFWNQNQRKFFFNNTGQDQPTFTGWEMDYGTTFQWDDTFQFSFDFGWFFPGDFYQLSNVIGSPNKTESVFGATARVGVSF